MSKYEQLPFMYRLKLYALFISGKNDNPETHATLGTQDTGGRQSRDMQHWAHKTQEEDGI
jgi:hypothetical protein